MRVNFMELTVLWKEVVVEVCERKKLRYVELEGRSRAARMES